MFRLSVNLTDMSTLVSSCYSQYKTEFIDFFCTLIKSHKLMLKIHQILWTHTPLFRFPAYGPWSMEFPVQYSLPRHFCPIFLLVLALYTCLPLPTLLSIFFGILVSGLHIMALASRKESLQEEDHLRKVSSTFNIKKTECKLSTFLC